MKTIQPRHTYIGDLCTAVTGPVVDDYTATIGDGDQIAVVTDGVTAVLVGDFVYFLGGTPGETHDPTWLHCTAAEYAKWVRV
jgi:hypothetical protein